MESWIGARINSPHVARVLEADCSKSCLYYLTEYVSGMTLTQWMREHPKPAVEEVVYLLDQIAKGIRAMHRREALHRDIKPDNIMIDVAGQVKIIDLGACHVAGIAEISTPWQRDVVLGTASYSAPEYVLDRQAGYRSDLFSLGVICYEMLSGKPPYSGKLEHCRKERDFVTFSYTESYKLNPRVPLWIDCAIRKALAINGESRHGDISGFVYELQNPNPDYLAYHQRPLVERDPLKAWKSLCAALASTQIVTLALLLH